MEGLKVANILTIFIMVLAVFASFGATAAQPAAAPGPAETGFGIMAATDGPAPAPTSGASTFFVPLILSAVASIFAYLF